MVREHNLWNVASWQRVRKRRVCKVVGKAMSYEVCETCEYV